MPNRKRRDRIVDEDARRQVARAYEDIGASVTDRLSWVVHFIGRDLARLTPPERVADGFALRLLATSYPHDQEGRFVPSASEVAIDARKGPLPDRVILRLHRELRAGIQRVLAPLPMTAPRASPQPRGWQLPARQRRVLVRLPFEPYGPRDYFFATATGAADEHGAIVEAIVWLIEHSGNQLRACAKCDTPFVGVKRQEYCSPQCSQAVRNRKRPRRKGRKP